ncbi:MAG: VanZ family protein, partial [Gemmatimonadales bacterium]
GGRPPLRAAMVGGGLSLAIELIQLLVPGRDPSLSDLLTNTVGAFLGALLGLRWRAIALPSPAGARWLVAGFGGLWLAQVAGTAYAVHPALPASIYWGQLAPELGQFERFEGEVIAAGVGPVRLPSAQLRNSADVRQLLLEGQPLWADALPGPPTAGLAPVVSIFDGEQREIALVGRWGDDLVYRLRTRAFDLRLRPPAVRLADGFAPGETGAMVVEGRLSRGPLSFIVAIDSGITGKQVVPMSAQWGWSLLLPFDYAHGRGSGWLTAVWLTGWMLPLGWWAGRASPWSGLLAAIAVLLLGLIVIPSSAGLPVGWSTETVPALGALAVGGWLARSAGRASEPEVAPSRQR